MFTRRRGSEKWQNKSMIVRNTRVTRPTHHSHMKSLIYGPEQVSQGSRFHRSLLVLVGTYTGFSLDRWASQLAQWVKNLTAMQETGDARSIPGLGRSPGGRHGNPFRYSCLENPMDRGAWWATVHGVTKIQAQLKRLCACAHTHSTSNSLQMNSSWILSNTRYVLSILVVAGPQGMCSSKLLVGQRSLTGWRPRPFLSWGWAALCFRIL